ncbi:hypothetical protein N7471_013505 [Penicillium samsonianum]|uniref:uncharacterized protein n=1 Tax=Penicillium samsonianum TaxID=1882272 RepID=UPI0025494F6A|nr:uncharacterized protein N7471_013505 [Penicillium samsonianum]KAJ6118885.1 hypothetical protein N7471_013505 [Penicillium samsonianum]
MTSERFVPRALSIEDLPLPPEAARQQQSTAVPTESTKVAVVTRSADPEEEKPALFANAKIISFEWDNSSSKVAASRRKNQARVSQRRRNRIKQYQSSMADVNAYSSELHFTPDFKVQEETQKAELAKSLLPLAEWTFFESLNITKKNSMLLDFE